VKSGSTAPDWVNSQEEDTQEQIKKYWRSTIANNADRTLKNRSVAVRQFANWFSEDITEAESSDIED